jgi:hypothetical protein
MHCTRTPGLQRTCDAPAVTVYISRLRESAIVIVRGLDRKDLLLDGLCDVALRTHWLAPARTHTRTRAVSASDHRFMTWSQGSADDTIILRWSARIAPHDAHARTHTRS